MSDVREQLVKLFAIGYGETPARKMADAILERFDVTPKPVITDQKLGEIVLTAYRAGHNSPSSGAAMHRELWNAGLKIVRVDE